MRVKPRSRSSGDGKHAGLARLAKGQHGVVSIRQLEQKLGYSQSAISRAKAAGWLHRVHRGVYAVGHTDLSLQGRCLAAVLASGPDALLSHYSAGWLWGLIRTNPIPVHVTAPTRRAPRPPIRLHSARNLVAEDGALEDCIPVTSVARALLDLAAAVDFEWLRRMLKRSEELGIFDLRGVESVLDRNRGHHGATPLRQAIAIYRPSPFTRSDLEDEFSTSSRRMGPTSPSSGTANARRTCSWPGSR